MTVAMSLNSPQMLAPFLHILLAAECFLCFALQLTSHTLVLHRILNTGSIFLRVTKMSGATAIVTGASAGIGRALASALSAKGVQVLAVARRSAALHEAFADDANVTPVVGDVGSVAGREAVRAALEATKRPLDFLVHNAGTVKPLASLASVSLDDWRNAMAVNVEGPLFLTQACLPLMPSGSRVLHVSSGSAHAFIPGWGAYCVSKSALLGLKNGFKQEVTPSKGVLFASIIPGIVDTEMQAAIREADEMEVPLAPMFKQLHAAGKLNTPAAAAAWISDVLTEMSDVDYVAENDREIPSHLAPSLTSE
jgi:NAD(P)-dependent dehydrogenase (short-subunit alcohol dehydrogenase family)